MGHLSEGDMEQSHAGLVRRNGHMGADLIRDDRTIPVDDLKQRIFTPQERAKNRAGAEAQRNLKNPESQFRRTGMEVAKKTAYGAATRGIGAAPRILAEQAYKNTVSSAAKRAANRYSAKRPGTAATSGESEGDNGKPKKKMIGIAFWLMLLLAIFKDVLDVIGDFTIIFSVVSILTGPLVSFCVLFYLYVNKVSFSTRNVVTFLITTVLGWIPFLNLLPETTLNLILIRLFENSAFAKKGITKAVSKIV